MVDSILGFLLAIFGALQLQLGVAYTEQIIHRLLGMFTQDQLRETMSQEMSAGTRVLEKFLRILRLLAQQTGSSFKTLLPNIITFCLDQIHPLIAEVSFQLVLQISEPLQYVENGLVRLGYVLLELQSVSF